jgi:hypothetical protein
MMAVLDQDIRDHIEIETVRSLCDPRFSVFAKSLISRFKLLRR